MLLKYLMVIFLGTITMTSFASVPMKEQGALKKLNNQVYTSSKDVLPMKLEGPKSQKKLEGVLKNRTITLSSEEAYQLLNLIHEQENKIYRLKSLLNYSINQTHYDPRQDPHFTKKVTL